MLIIDQTGSINQDARQMGMSYKKAWEMIRSLNTGYKTIGYYKTGSEKGGCSIITEEAKQ